MKKLLSIASAMLIIFISCQVNYEKTKSGLKYKIYKGDGKGEAIKAGSFIKFDIEYRFQGKDSVLISSFGKMPGYSVVDSSERSAYSFMEVLPKAKVGDSIVVVMSIDSLVSKKMIPGYDNLYHRGDNIIGKIKVLGVYPSEQAMMADYQKEIELTKQREVKILQDYITKNKINAQKTANGVFVEIQQQGNGEKADTGKVAYVFYKGYLLDGKKVFDTNMDASFQHTEAYQVLVGAMQTIPGWEEALPYFNEGGKGRLYVPSHMAYGAQGRPPVIPANATLIFDMEVKDVQDAPKTQPGQQQPQQPQQ
jgi:FKBP-type peptidyl-prolyl cis-trans isomerase FkpA